MKLIPCALSGLLLITGQIFAMQKIQEDLNIKLYEAVRTQSPLEIIADLIVQGADVNARGEDSKTPLMIAVARADGTRNSLDIIKFLLNNNANMYAYYDDVYKLGPLTFLYTNRFSYQIYMEIIKLFLDHGYFVNRVVYPQTRYTLLMSAALNLDCRSVTMLLQRGANIWLKNCYNETVIDIALKSKFCLIELAKTGIQASRKILQANPQIVNNSDERGNTLLHHAVLTEHPEWIAYLLSMGADPEIKNKKGQNPLDLLVDIGMGPNYPQMVGVFAKAAGQKEKVTSAEKMENVPAAASSSK